MPRLCCPGRRAAGIRQSRTVRNKRQPSRSNRLKRYNAALRMRGPRGDPTEHLKLQERSKAYLKRRRLDVRLSLSTRHRLRPRRRRLCAISRLMHRSNEGLLDHLVGVGERCGTLRPIEHSQGLMLINNSCGRRDNFRTSGGLQEVTSMLLQRPRLLLHRPGKPMRAGVLRQQACSLERWGSHMAEKVNVVKTRQANNQ